ncbi:hypothetical protein D3C84_527850 [compost metagenome]
MGAGDITQFHQRVGDLAGIAVGDQQVAFFRLDRQLGAQVVGLDAVGQYDCLSAQPLAVIESHAIAIDLADPRPTLFDVGGVEHPVGGRRSVENAVAVDQQTAFEVFAQFRFTGAQGITSDQLAGNALGLKVQVLAVGHGHFFGIGCQPQRPVAAVSAAFRQVRRQFAPALQRVLAQGQLGRVVVEHQQVAHTGGRRTVQASVQHQHAQAAPGQRLGARGTDDAGTDHDDIGHQALAHGRMPQANGSSCSMIRLASALMKARPRIVGTMRSPCCS